MRERCFLFISIKRNFSVVGHRPHKMNWNEKKLCLFYINELYLVEKYYNLLLCAIVVRLFGHTKSSQLEKSDPLKDIALFDSNGSPFRLINSQQRRPNFEKSFHYENYSNARMYDAQSTVAATAWRVSCSIFEKLTQFNMYWLINDCVYIVGCINLRAIGVANSFHHSFNLINIDNERCDERTRICRYIWCVW